MKCRICNNESTLAFRGKVMASYEGAYHHCSRCGFLQVEDPFWLDEAYENPINPFDTGILTRNLQFADAVSTLVYHLFDHRGKYLDYSGGYGIFTRLMRDRGFDWYWKDPYTDNLLARGFEHRGGDPISLVTAFECFEHFLEPRDSLEEIVSISRNILFSTVLLPDPLPGPGKWWYYSPEHGQHVSFYSCESLRQLGKLYGLNFVSNGHNLHLFSENPVREGKFRFFLKYRKYFLLPVKRKMQSKTEKDMKDLVGRR